MIGANPFGEAIPLRRDARRLASLFVAPEFRGQGVARRLVKAIEDHARRNAVRRLYLYTVDAEDFYLKCGWAVVERLAVGGGDLILMARGL